MSNIKRWKLIADNCIMAKSDLSVFKHRSTIIAKATREFFSLNNLEPGHSVNFTLVFNNAEYSAKVEHLKSGGQQTRITWESELKQEIDKNFPNVIKNETYPYMKFIKLGDKKFQLAFFSDNSDENEVPLDLETEIISEIEGRRPPN